VVKGDIVAEQVQIDGEVRGLIKARHVRVAETGKVTGIVMYETLSIKDGAFIDGQCKNTDVAIKDREKATQRLAEDHSSEKKKLSKEELKLVEGLNSQE
jgi:cytoskeletal protein CcmA (bactofilin family)